MSTRKRRALLDLAAAGSYAHPSGLNTWTGRVRAMQSSRAISRRP